MATETEKNAGIAARACRRMIWKVLPPLMALCAAAALATTVVRVGMLPLAAALTLSVLLFLFILYFFRDPSPKIPTDPGLYVCVGHGKVDQIEEITEPEFMQGPCHRVSIFLSVFNVHVQNAPVSGSVVFMKHRPGLFLNAMNPESAIRNENLLIGIESSEQPGQKVALRLISGLIARRIVPFIRPGETVQRGERIGLIQFGSRCDMYFPLSFKIQVRCGDHVKGGETIIARQ
jgi:phosphatidylserine decarboxylase